MAQTLTLFYAFALVAEGIALASSDMDGLLRDALVTAFVPACGLVVGLSRWGPRWPRPLLNALVLAAVPITALSVVVVPDPLVAVASAALMTFVAVDVHLFFRLALARSLLAVAVAAASGALLVRGDVPAPVAAMNAAVVLALAVAARRLVVQALGARRDALTGLVNRRGFDDAAAELMERDAAELSVALLDLDHFKAVNDTQGHQAGDHLLRRVADVWTGELPTSAVLARHGGDEFALLLPGASGPEALALVRRIVTLHPDVGMSCGVAERRPGEGAGALMRRADRALYVSKEGGRGRSSLDGVVDPGARAPA